MAQSHRNAPGDSCFFLEGVGMPNSDWTPNFKYVIVHYRRITLKLSMHQFLAYATGKTPLSFKRSSEGTLKVVMVNVIEVLLSRIFSSVPYFLKYTLQNLTAYFI